MSYDTQKAKLGREPFIKCKLIMDYCTLTAGVAPCTATQTGDSKCFNTRATCNDPDNYTKGTKEYTFCQPRSNLPKGVEMFPVLDKQIQKASTSITSGSGLGKRAVVKLRLKDFIHHDIGIDPYVSERSYNPEEQGTFWGKFLARNPYYEGRTLEVAYGYIGDTYSAADFETQVYDVTDIDGVTNNEVIITGKDVLIRTYDRKAQYPVASNGTLLLDILASESTATLTPSGIGDSEYPASGTVSIGDEAKTFTRSGDVLTFTAHGQWGTTGSAHDAGDTVQLCVTWDGDVTTDNVTDVLDELLTTGAGLSSSLIPTVEWDVEKDLWLASAIVKGILMKPESIEKIISELSEVFMFDLWWAATEQLMKLKALSPEASGETVNLLTEGSNIVQGSLKILRDSKKRFTEVQVHYGKIDYSGDNDLENYRTVAVVADVSRSGADKYDANSIKVLKSRWFDLNANAVQLAGRYLARFSDTPELITFKLDQKDDSKLGLAERIELNSWQFQDFNGANEVRKFQVTEINEGKEAGHDFTVKALTSSFIGRYFFIAPNGTPDYPSASDLQKEKYGFICLNTGLFADGTEGYKII